MSIVLRVNILVILNTCVKPLIELKEYINFSINRSGVNDDNEEPSDY